MTADRLISIAGAVAVHLVLVGLLAFNMSNKSEAPARAEVKPLVQARVVSEEEALAPMRRRQAEEARRQAAEDKRRTEEARHKAAEEQRRKAAEKARLVEQKKKQEAEKARLAEQERQRKIEAEKQRKAEAERQAAEKRRKAEEARKQQEVEDQLKQALAAEEERLAREQQLYRQQRLQGVRQQYIADIRNKVERNWLRPTGSRGSHCRVLIHQIPGGEVVDVRLNECDGDVAFQRSVEAAVRKASPLPPAPDPEVFEREIEFIFEPQRN